jgi:hypothetical protein
MEDLKYSAIHSTFEIIFRDKTHRRYSFSENIFKLVTNIAIISEILINYKFENLLQYNGIVGPFFQCTLKQCSECCNFQNLN